MTAEQLKASVLQMAIEGKLVPQLDDEPAVDIEAVEPEEVPFAIPEKWKWVELGNIVKISSPRRIHKDDWRSEGVPFLRARELANLADTLVLKNELYIEEKVYLERERKGEAPSVGDILMTAVGTLGKCYVFKEGDRFFCKDTNTLRMENFSKQNGYYIRMLFQSPYILELIKKTAVGSTVKNLTIGVLNKYLIPLPPLGEQGRILTRLNEILPLIEEYGKAHSALKNAEEALPDQLRASLLQEAIQGKLVPQLEDEPAVDIEAVEPEEIPFAIHEKWKWVTLTDIVKVIPSKNYQIQAKQVLPEGELPVVSQSKNYIDGYSNERDKLLSKDDLPIILFGDHTRVVKFIDFQFVVGADGTKLLHPKSKIDGKFLYYLLQYNVLGMRNRGYSRHFQFLKAIPIPLPPLAEQRRIVARLEELLPHVNAIAGLR